MHMNAYFLYVALLLLYAYCMLFLVFDLVCEEDQGFPYDCCDCAGCFGEGK